MSAMRWEMLLSCCKTPARIQRSSASPSYWAASSLVSGNDHGVFILPMVMLGDDFKSFKDDTQYKNSKLSMTSFMQQEEERAFFWLSPANPHGQRNVFAHIPAFIPEPTQEVRSLLPYVDWQQELPYNPEQAFPTADDPSYDEDQDATAAGQITPSSVAPLDPALVTKPFWQDAALLNIMQEPADSSTSAPGPATKEVCHRSCAL